MTKSININREILIEKGNFVIKNNAFFYNNLNNPEILISLKNILLNPIPLEQCQEYEDLLEEIKKAKIRNIEELCYTYSIQTLFAVINIIRSNHINLIGNTKSGKIEILRLYVKYINSQVSGKMYYSNQNCVTIDKEKAEAIIAEDRQHTKKRRN